MPNPMIGEPVPHDGVGRHSAPSEVPPPYGSPPRVIPTQLVPAARRAGQTGSVEDRPRGEMAVELPDWDLLPPVEFVRRHRGGS